MKLRKLTPDEGGMVKASLESTLNLLREQDPAGIEARKKGIPRALEQIETFLKLIEHNPLLLLDREGDTAPGEIKIIEQEITKTTLKQVPDGFLQGGRNN
jgi:hypothetical protein